MANNTSSDYIKVNLLFELFENGRRGISRERLEEIYEDEKGERPTEKAIYRLVTQLDAHLQRQSVRVAVQKTTYGRTRYYLEDAA